MDYTVSRKSATGVRTSRKGHLEPRSAQRRKGQRDLVVATGATDMRLSFNGLYALVVGQLKQDPQSGHLFLIR